MIAVTRPSAAVAQQQDDIPSNDPTSEDTWAGMERYTFTSLGPASTAFPFVGAQRVGDVLYCVSRNIRPPRVAAYDLRDSALVADIELPPGDGAWAVASDGEEWLYLVQFGTGDAPNVFRVDLASEAVETLGTLDSDFAWDLDVAPDGVVYGVASGSTVFRFDPAVGEVEVLDLGDAGPEEVRSLRADEARIYVGGIDAGRCRVQAFDRETLESSDLTPDALADDQICYALERSGRMLAAGTRGPDESDPGIALIDLESGATEAAGRASGDSVIDTLVIDDDAVYGTLRTSGDVIRLDRASSDVESLAGPVPNAEHRTLTLWEQRLVAAAGNGAIWSMDPDDDGDADVVDLVLDGVIEGGPERVQSVAAAEGVVYGGGTFGFERKNVAAETAERFFAAGEPKDMVVVDGAAYLALYPGAEVWVLPAEADQAHQLTQFAVEQNRPQAIAHEPERDLLIVTTGSDRQGGGALHIIERRSGDLVRSVTNPIDEVQVPTGVAVRGRFAYIGGSGDDASIICWDLDEDAEAWRIDALHPEVGQLAGLAVAGTQRLFAMSGRGWLVGVDLDTQTVEAAERLADRAGRLVATHQSLYVAGYDELFRVVPLTYEVEVIRDDMGAIVWGFPPIDRDGDDLLYVVEGMDLLQVAIQRGD